MKAPTKLLAIATLLAATAAYAIQVQLTPEEIKMCEENGGCVFVPMSEIEKALEAAYNKGFIEGKYKCEAVRKREV